MLIYFSGAFPALADRPHNQRLTTPHVARSEYFWNIGLITFVRSPHVSTLIQRYFQGLQHTLMLRVKKTHGQENDFAGYLALRVRLLYKLTGAAIITGLPFQFRCQDGTQLALIVAQESLGND